MRVVDWFIEVIIDHPVIVCCGFGLLLCLAVIGMGISEANCTKHEKQTQVIMVWAGNGIFVPIVQEVDVCVEWKNHG